MENIIKIQLRYTKLNNTVKLNIFVHYIKFLFLFLYYIFYDLHSFNCAFDRVQPLVGHIEPKAFFFVSTVFFRFSFSEQQSDGVTNTPSSIEKP